MNKTERATEMIKKAIDDATLGLDSKDYLVVLEEVESELGCRMDAAKDEANADEPEGAGV